jgi:PAS domain S-box-containing protein
VPEQLQAMAEALAAHGRISDCEMQIRTKDGAVLDGLFSVEVINGQGSRYLLSVMIDISVRKRAQALLREKEAELDRYFSSSLDLLCIADMAGHFQRLNPEWESVLGYPITELEGRPFLELVHPDDREATLAAVARLEGQNEVRGFENRYRRRDGSYAWIEWRSKPMGTRIYAVARDITERKRIEQALRATNAELAEATAKAEQATPPRASLLPNMSHEIRTPMNGVIGHDRACSRHELDATQRRYAETVRSSGQTLLLLINDILDFSKIEAGKMELENLDFDLRDCRRLRHIMAVRAAEKGIEFIWRQAGGADGVARRSGPAAADPHKPRRQRFKFTQKARWPCGSISSAARKLGALRFSVRTPASEYRVKQGCVEKFTQVDASTTRKYGGTAWLGDLQAARRVMREVGVLSDGGVDLNSGSLHGWRCKSSAVTPAAASADSADLKAYGCNRRRQRHQPRDPTRSARRWGMRPTDAVDGRRHWRNWFARSDSAIPTGLRFWTCRCPKWMAPRSVSPSATRLG